MKLLKADGIMWKGHLCIQQRTHMYVYIVGTNSKLMKLIKLNLYNHAVCIL